MPDTFDTIVVGARCAGASLAAHLSRAGQKVLLVDAAPLPSDQPMSTHSLGPIGVELLDELGVGAEVRRLSPASHTVRIDMAGATVRASPTGPTSLPAPRGPGIRSGAGSTFTSDSRRTASTASSSRPIRTFFSSG
jgi:2-polyprenyl-6-methoxyphenol hydroxylase-like FAD-dependent oxidoreductase